MSSSSKSSINPFRIRILLTRVFAGVVAVGLLVTRSKWAETHPIICGFVLLYALILSSVAMAGRMWCSLYIAGYKNVCLVTTGPYSLCRNPLYFFSFVGVIGIACATFTVTIPLAMALVFGLYYPGIIAQEAEYLRKKHGASFDAFESSTPAFLPRISQYHADELREVKPEIFRRHLGSAMCFPIAVGVVYVIGLVRPILGLPAWFTLP